MTQDPVLRATRAAPRPTWRLRFAAMFMGMATIGGAHSQEKSVPVARAVASVTDNAKETRMWMTANGQRFEVTLTDTDTARAFAARLPMTLDMTDLNDNEKKSDLSKNLPAKPMRPGTIRNGDLMLWGDNTVVVFYKSFESTYSYTRLGQLSDPTGLAQTLGRDGVQVQFSAMP